jgi:hypothetical protein
VPANDGCRENFDVNFHALALQQVALLVDRPAHQWRHRRLLGVQPVVGFARDAQEHFDCGFHLERRTPDPIDRPHIFG